MLTIVCFIRFLVKKGICIGILRILCAYSVCVWLCVAPLHRIEEILRKFGVVSIYKLETEHHIWTLDSLYEKIIDFLIYSVFLWKMISSPLTIYKKKKKITEIWRNYEHNDIILCRHTGNIIEFLFSACYCFIFICYAFIKYFECVLAKTKNLSIQ